MGALHCEQNVIMVDLHLILWMTIALPLQFLAYGGFERPRTGTVSRTGTHQAKRTRLDLSDLRQRAACSGCRLIMGIQGRPGPRTHRPRRPTKVANEYGEELRSSRGESH